MELPAKLERGRLETTSVSSSLRGRSTIKFLKTLDVFLSPIVKTLEKVTNSVAEIEGQKRYILVWALLKVY